MLVFVMQFDVLFLRVRPDPYIISSDKHKLDVAWNTGNCFRKVLMLVGEKVLNRCYFTAELCLLHYS